MSADSPKTSCTYCRKELDPNNIVISRTTFRSYDSIRRKQIVVTKEFPYCKDKPCAAHDQMAREG